MKFADIKNDVIAPKNQRIIDKKILLDGEVFHVISAYEEGDDVKIIAINILDIEDKLWEEVDFSNIKTVRDERMMIAKTKDYANINGGTIYFDNKEIDFHFKGSSVLCENHYDFFMVSYIISLGIDLDYLDNISLSSTRVSTFVINDIGLDSLDFSGVRSLKTIKSPTTESILVNADFSLTLNKESYSFTDENNVKHKFEAWVEIVDIWGGEVPYIKKNIREAYEKNGLELKEAELLKMVDEVTSMYEEMCPRDMNLLYVAYESEVQLEFYKKGYLDSEIDRSNPKSIWFVHSNDSAKREVIGNIKGFDVETVDIELFSWLRNIQYDATVIDF